MEHRVYLSVPFAAMARGFKMKSRTLLGIASLALAITAWASGPQQNSTTNSKATSGQHAPRNDASEGETKFNQNCGRCHTAPTSISPRIAKTVLRHMRVRASLSKEDEQAILKFLAPTLEP